MNSSHDLFLRRAYTHKSGVEVVVDIDLVSGKISLVDRKGIHKKWLFTERELAFMQSWQNILDAMKYAIAEATELLREREQRITEETARQMIEVDEALKPRKG